MTIYVLQITGCAEGKWVKLRQEYGSLRVILQPRPQSYSAFVNSLIYDTDHDHALVIRDDAWLPKLIETNVERLVQDYDSRFGRAHWGVIGNEGIVYPTSEKRRLRQSVVNSTFEYFLSPSVATTVDESIMLLNLAAMREQGLRFPEMPGYFGHGVILSAECYRYGLLSCIDRRLYCLFENETDDSESALFLESDEFRKYWSEHFINHRLFTACGTLDLTADIDYSYLKTAVPAAVQEEEGDDAPLLKDYYQLIDQALASSNVGNNVFSLAIIIRTQFKRPDLLRRALQSVHVASISAIGSLGGGLQPRVHIVTDVDPHVAEQHLSELRSTYDSLCLNLETVEPSVNRASRVNLLLEGFRRIDADFFWVVDDDDFIFHNAFESIAKTLLDKHTLLIGCSQGFEEVRPESFEKLCPRLSKPTKRFESALYYENYSGLNHIPICSVIYPAAIKKVMFDFDWSGDYLEDYFLHVAALALKGVSVVALPQTIAGISLRPQENDNVVTQRDRSGWHQSQASIVGEMINRDEFGPQVMWDIFKSKERMQAQFSGGNDSSAIRIAHAIQFFWRDPQQARRLPLEIARIVLPRATRQRLWRTIRRFPWLLKLAGYRHEL